MKQSISSFNDETVASSSIARLGMALQGGGAHGAFQAGVFEALAHSDLFQTGQVQIKALSGTSAGTMNGAIITHALNSSQRDLPDRLKMANKELNAFWDSIGRGTKLMTSMDAFNRQAFNIVGLGFLYPDLKVKDGQWPNLSEKQLEILNRGASGGSALENLKFLLQMHAPDWNKVQQGDVKFYSNAVKLKNPSEGFVRKNMEHVLFHGETLTRDAAVASGALRVLGAQSVKGVPHYDGAYLKNPDFTPFNSEDITDLLVVMIQDKPEGKLLPMKQEDIVSSGVLPENTTVGKEVHHHLEYMKTTNPPYAIHKIELEHEEHWDHSTKFNTDPEWLSLLHKKGFEAGEKWLNDNPFKHEPEYTREKQAKKRSAHVSELSLSAE